MQTESAKYLSLNINNKLSWEDHFTKTATKAFLQRNLRAWPKDIRAKCYTTLVRPIVEYAGTVWDPHVQKHIDCVEKVQRRAARFVYQYFQRTSNVTTMMNSLGWESLAERRAKAKVVMLYRAIHGLVALPISLQQTVSTTTHTQASFFIPYCRTATLRHSFFPDTARLWNNLPMGVVTAPSLESFKSGLHGCLVR